MPWPIIEEAPMKPMRSAVGGVTAEVDIFAGASVRARAQGRATGRQSARKRADRAIDIFF